MPAETDELIALSDIARLANAQPSTVSNWRKRYDTFPSEVRREGRQILFARDEVVRWLEQHSPASPRTATPAEIRESVDADDISEVALALLCLTSQAADDVARIAAAETPIERFKQLAELSTLTERQLAMPDLFLALREPAAGVDYSEFSFAVNRALFEFARDGRAPLTRQLAADRFEHQLARLNQTRARRLAETRSPRWLADLMVALAEADHGLVLDPAAGEAGGLIAAGQAATGAVELRGWEINATTHRLARQRLLVHGLPATVEHVDSLGDSTLTPLHASAVISDPPMGLRERPDRWSAADPRWAFGLPAPHADLAWVQLALFHLAPGARAAILTGQGALFRSGYEARIRAQLLQAGAIEAIIGLPPAPRSTHKYRRRCGCCALPTLVTLPAACCSSTQALLETTSDDLKPLTASTGPSCLRSRHGSNKRSSPGAKTRSERCQRSSPTHTRATSCSPATPTSLPPDWSTSRRLIPRSSSPRTRPFDNTPSSALALQRFRRLSCRTFRTPRSDGQPSLASCSRTVGSS